MTKLAADNFEVASLSTEQIYRMLETLELHRTMLQAGHEDASRLALQGRPPGYILDFDLIFRYAFQAVDRPDWASEIDYLLDSPTSEFLIGPGTHVEMSNFMHAVGVPIGDNGNFELHAFDGMLDRQTYGLPRSTVRYGLYRINVLLSRPNVRGFDEIATDAPFTDRALTKARRALDETRGALANNHWDALNWIAVEHLRQRESTADWNCFPYLLTGTKSLIFTSSWKDVTQVAVAREPSDAIYTELLLRRFSTPGSAARHTLNMALKAASLEGQLRNSPALSDPERFAHEPEWESAITEERVSERFRIQLQELARFVSDPVIGETQRLYDNLRQASASASQQRGTVLDELTDSPRKLFDLIVEVDAALRAKHGDAGLADIWTSVLDMHLFQQDGRSSYELFDRGRDRETSQYLAAECYLGAETQGDRQSTDQMRGHQQYVLRWPTSLDAESVVTTFSRAFLNHHIETVDLVVGTQGRVQHFEATLPIDLSDVMQAVSDYSSLAQQADPLEDRDPSEEPLHQQLDWLRMGATVFDLYADIAPAAATNQPVVGVFVHSLQADHLQDLYSRTAARYLLPAWFKQAIQTLSQ